MGTGVVTHFVTLAAPVLCFLPPLCEVAERLLVFALRIATVLRYRALDQHFGPVAMTCFDLLVIRVPAGLGVYPRVTSPEDNGT